MKELVFNYLLKFPDGETPTKIGLALGKTYTCASSSVSPALKCLVKEGKVERVIKKPGVIIYKVILKSL